MIIIIIIIIIMLWMISAGTTATTTTVLKGDNQDFSQFSFSWCLAVLRTACTGLD